MTGKEGFQGADVESLVLGGITAVLALEWSHTLEAKGKLQCFEMHLQHD